MPQTRRGQKVQKEIPDRPAVAAQSPWSQKLQGRIAKPAKPRPTKKFRVRASRLGYYGERRRREGDVFVMAVPVGPANERSEVQPGEPDFPTWVVPLEPVAEKAAAPEDDEAVQSGYSVSSGRSDEESEDGE